MRRIIPALLLLLSSHAAYAGPIVSIPVGGSSLTPTAGMTPLAEGDATIDELWIPTLTARDIGGFTASRAVASDADGKLVESTVTATELGYLSGVTSAIQTQIDTISVTETDPIAGAVTGIVKADGAGNLGAVTIGSGLSYVAGTLASTASGAFAVATSVVTGDATLSASDFGSAGISPVAVRNACTLTLPTAAANLYRPFFLESGNTVIFKPASASDVLRYNGTALLAGHQYSCTTDGIVLVSGTAANAWSLGGTATCSDGGSIGSTSLVSAPTSWDYGSVNTSGSTSAKTFNVTIVGSLTSVAAALTTGTNYSITSNTCTGSLSDTTCATEVTFDPTTTGALTDTLTFSATEISDVTVSLTGTGTADLACTLVETQDTRDGTSYGHGTTFCQKLKFTAESTICRMDIYHNQPNSGTLSSHVEVWSTPTLTGTQYGGDSDTVAATAHTHAYVEYAWSTNPPVVSSDVYACMVQDGTWISGATFGYTATVTKYEDGAYDIWRNGADVNYDLSFKLYTEQ